MGAMNKTDSPGATSNGNTKGEHGETFWILVILFVAFAFFEVLCVVLFLFYRRRKHKQRFVIQNCKCACFVYCIWLHYVFKARITFWLRSSSHCHPHFIRTNATNCSSLFWYLAWNIHDITTNPTVSFNSLIQLRPFTRAKFEATEDCNSPLRFYVLREFKGEQ